MMESATMKPTSCVYDVKCASCHGRGLGGWWSLPGMRWDTRRRLKVFSRRMRLSPLTVAFRVQAARPEADDKKAASLSETTTPGRSTRYSSLQPVLPTTFVFRTLQILITDLSSNPCTVEGTTLAEALPQANDWSSCLGIQKKEVLGNQLQQLRDSALSLEIFTVIRREAKAMIDPKKLKESTGGATGSEVISVSDNEVILALNATSHMSVRLVPLARGEEEQTGLGSSPSLSSSSPRGHRHSPHSAVLMLRLALLAAERWNLECEDSRRLKEVAAMKLEDALGVIQRRVEAAQRNQTVTGLSKGIANALDRDDEDDGYGTFRKRRIFGGNRQGFGGGGAAKKRQQQQQQTQLGKSIAHQSDHQSLVPASDVLVSASWGRPWSCWPWNESKKENDASDAYDDVDPPAEQACKRWLHTLIITSRHALTAGRLVKAFQGSEGWQLEALGAVIPFSTSSEYVLHAAQSEARRVLLLRVSGTSELVRTIIPLDALNNDVSVGHRRLYLTVPDLQGMCARFDGSSGADDDGISQRMTLS